MRMRKTPEVTEKHLLFVDFVSVYEPGLKTKQINHEELFKRIQKQRGEVVQQVAQQVEKPAGDLIDVRLRVAAADKRGCVHFSEVINEENKVVA